MLPAIFFWRNAIALALVNGPEHLFAGILLILSHADEGSRHQKLMQYRVSRMDTNMQVMWAFQLLGNGGFEQCL